ncbi:hypothetical protein CSIM01_13350 [Colletotrichum simmondsii]|uniref:Glucose-methanol-choline oxidoreductase N-terminal domain-containing protein n=1 Tax=Colletotrichum simmondsii TaxID=703756 RepID=A0A135RZC8_9PEZI|nr:hypothetical protein CSIM01_13350 [Colletotrichum simmondsii]
MHTESLPDYLTIPGKTSLAFTAVYPVPGVQEPTSTSVMARDYFASSGFTALAFIQKAVELDPYIKILCLERGKKGDDDDFVRVIETSKGTLSWASNKTKIILCAGTVLNATMLLSSFESCRDTVGKRLTGHYDTHISARCPVKNVKGWKKEEKLKIAAAYLAAKDPKTDLQYQVSVTAFHSSNPKDDAEDAARECPYYAAAATLDQLTGSEDYVVFVCSALGELSEQNTKNHIALNKGTDPTCNVTLQYTLCDDDRTSWNVMDEATFNTMIQMAGGNEHKPSIEWWDETTHGWIKTRPTVDTIRIPGIVQESSTCFMGPKEIDGSVDELYRPHGD